MILYAKIKHFCGILLIRKHYNIFRLNVVDPDPESGPFYHQAKIVRKTLVYTALYFFMTFLLFTDEKSRIRIRKSGVRIHGSGSVPKCHSSGKNKTFILNPTNFCEKKYFLGATHNFPNLRVRSPFHLAFRLFQLQRHFPL